MNSRLVRLKTAFFFFRLGSSTHFPCCNVRHWPFRRLWHNLMFVHFVDCTDEKLWCSGNRVQTGVSVSPQCVLSVHILLTASPLFWGEIMSNWENALLRHLCADSSVWCVVSSVFFADKDSSVTASAKNKNWNVGREEWEFQQTLSQQGENFPVSKEDCNLQRVGLVYALNVP